LLLASTINYMDRQTLANTSVQITKEMQLSEEQYGQLELAFGLAFAVGATIFGVIVDRTNLRWLYPIVLLLWSGVGFATGLVETYAGLLLCRLLLGLFEAGHWPCALKTTQRLLPPESRTLGNSVLQSGTAIGAIATPILIRWLTTDTPGSWRPIFQIIGALGLVWAVLWLMSIKTSDFEAAPAPTVLDPTATDNASPEQPTFASLVFSRQFLMCLIVVVSINICWHQFRVWMPKFLEVGRGYSRNQMLDINTAFNIMTDVGCISAGLMTAALFRRGATVFASRFWVFTFCSLLVATGAAIPWLAGGPQLVAVLMIVALGSLGLFPCFYAFSQELSATHQGKITGTLATIAWIIPSLWHWQFGRWVDQTKSYDLGMFIASLLPLVAVAALVVLGEFGRKRPEQT
jgi:ACS family hexuronate transporter-like MFS transporter